MDHAVASPEARPLRRHVGKCKACKRAFSVMARFVRIDHDAGVPFNCRKTQSGKRLDAMFQAASGLMLPGVLNSVSVVVVCGCKDLPELVELQQVHAILKAGHVCNASCLNSKNHICECSCGGVNHGISFNVH